MLALSSGTAALHLALLGARRRAGRRGDHDVAHVAGDRERDRPRGATPVFADIRAGDLNIDPERVRRARRPEDEGDPARRPLRPAGRPRPAARARARRSSRTRRTRSSRATAAGRSARSPPRPASRSTRRRTSRPARAGLLATNDAAVAQRRRRPPRDAPRPRLALRHRRPRLQGEPLRRARGDRARAARQARAPPRRFASSTSPPTTKPSASSTASTPSRATRATRTRFTSMSSGSTRSARGRRATSTNVRSRRRRSAPRSTSCPCTS